MFYVFLFASVFFACSFFAKLPGLRTTKLFLNLFCEYLVFGIWGGVFGIWCPRLLNREILSSVSFQCNLTPGIFACQEKMLKRD